jgi:phenylacetic acid degradation operon negative regulatory protein
MSPPAPRHLLLTLLGDYWFGCTEHLPSAALVRLLGEFGVSGSAARTALSRLARRGLLESAKVGRQTYYRPTGRAVEVFSEGRSHILGFGTHERPWAGTWVVTTFSIPEEQRHTRHALRARLRWLGFAPLYDGVWVSPWPRAEEAVEALESLGVDAATVLEARVVPDGPKLGDPISAWDVDELRSLYARFIDGFTPVAARARAGKIGAAEGLVTRTRVMDAWRNFPNLDPELPLELLGRGTPPSPRAGEWPRAAARRVFVDLYDTLGPLGEARVREIVAEFSPDLARLVSHHTTAVVDPRACRVEVTGPRTLFNVRRP